MFCPILAQKNRNKKSTLTQPIPSLCFFHPLLYSVELTLSWLVGWAWFLWCLSSIKASRAFERMPRPFAVKAGKKRKKRAEKYDKEEIEMVDEDTPAASTETEGEDDKEMGDLVKDMPGIPIAVSDQNSRSGAVFVLEKASLEVAKVGKTYQILNSEDHGNFLKKHNKNPADYRPDIVHQALLMILDSPLNKAGRVRAVYVKTEKGVLFEVKPHVRIPRTYKRFAGVMLQLLQKLSISAAGKGGKLFRVIKNPVTQYLPLNSRKIGFSYSSDKLVDIHKYVAAVKEDVNFVFVIGAMAHGKVDDDYVEDYIAISGYPMSAAWCIARICEGLQHKFNVL